MADPDQIDLEEVLLEFSSEPVHDRATFERYLREFPTMAEALVELSLDLRLRRATAGASAPVDEDWVDASWLSFRRAMSSADASAPVVDPFAAMTPAALTTVRRNLGVPSGVVHGFQTRVVDVTTVPKRFLGALARELGASLGGLRAFLGQPPRLAAGLSYKADDAPEVDGEPISFERLLLDTRVPDADRARLLEDEP